MKYQALFVILKKSSKILNCRLLQKKNVGDALGVRLFLFAAFKAANFQIDFFGNLVMRTAQSDSV